MKQTTLSYLENMHKSDVGVTSADIDLLQSNLDFELPQEYLDLMKKFNGAEGDIGDNSWLYFFPVENLIETNLNYSILMQDIPDYFLFGKDAADTGYAFHKRNHTYHSFGLMSNFATDTIDYCGDSIDAFIAHLYSH